MRHLYRTLAVAVSLGVAAVAVAQTTSRTPAPNPVSRGAPTTFYGPTKPAITNPLNNTGISRVAPRTTATRVTPVPEPSQWAMMLAGLALVGFIVRRSSKRS
ncbi:MAG TPA: PEPxxWA-CTERM sorting domain-containing protein [Usitatibacter sp.]|nr:PEPxxWA-CTERM sorting domain-containing protein [Usitatibacter sp.]